MHTIVNIYKKMTSLPKAKLIIQYKWSWPRDRGISLNEGTPTVLQREEAF